jgi:hypothetical protein
MIDSRPIVLNRAATTERSIEMPETLFGLQVPAATTERSIEMPETLFDLQVPAATTERPA